MNWVYDALDKQLDSPNFYIGMTLRGAPKTPPPARQIIAFLEKRLAPLNPDQMVDSLPHWRYEHSWWRIDFFPIPKPPHSRGETGIRPLATWEDNSWYEISPRLAVRKAIVKKGGRYGDLDLPYISCGEYPRGAGRSPRYTHGGPIWHGRV